MNKQLLHLLTWTLLFATASCSEDTPTPTAEQQPGQQVISLSRTETDAIRQAIADRKNMLGITTPDSRARDLEVKYVAGGRNSRSGASDTLLYVVNFPDEEGYAVIPKDKRLETLAVTESGSFSSIDEIKNPSARVILSAAQKYAEQSINTMSNGGATVVPTIPIPMQVIEFDTTNFVQIPTKIPYKWGQNGSLARFCPNYTTGCVPLACAMTLAYFGQPASMSLTYPSRDRNSVTFDWPSMRKHIKENNVQGNCWCNAGSDAHDQLAYLCRQLGELIGCDYSKFNATSGTISGALNALKSTIPSKSRTQKNIVRL